MPKRWERELRTLQNVPAPLERIRDRAERGSPSPVHNLPPHRQRIAAGLVALAVFLAAGAFAWRAFDGNGSSTGGRDPNGLPTLSAHLQSTGTLDNVPSDEDPWLRVETVIDYGDLHEVEHTSTTPTGAIVDWVGVEAMQHLVPGPAAGSTVTITTDGSDGRVLIGQPADWPNFDRFQRIDTLPTQPGNYVLIFAADYPEGMAMTARIVTLVRPGTLQVTMQKGGALDAATASASVDGDMVDGFLSTSSFTSGDDGAQSQPRFPSFANPLTIQVGAAIVLTTPADEVVAGMFADTAISERLPIDLQDGAWTPSEPPGVYRLVVDATWRKGKIGFGQSGTEEQARFLFPVEVLESESGPVNDQRVVVQSLPDDPCALLTSEQVAAATGSVVLSSSVIPDDRFIFPVEPNPCGYETDGPFAQVTVWVGHGRQAFIDARDRDPRNTDPVRGIGDEAFVNGKASIWVLVGDGAFSIDTQHGAGDEGVAMLKTLAQDALANLAAPAPASPAGKPRVVDALASRPIDLQGYAGAIAAGSGAVWVAVLGANQEPSLQRIDAATGDLEGSLGLPNLPTFLGVGDGRVWVPVMRGGAPEILEVDAETLEVTTTLPGFTGPVIEAGGAVWAVEGGTGPGDASVVRIEDGAVTARVPVGETPFDLAEAAGSVWVQERRDEGDVAGAGGVLRLDATTAEVLARLDLAAAGTWLAGDDSGVWLAAWLGPDGASSDASSAMISPDTNAIAPFGSIYNFRPFAVGDGRVWFVAGPGDGKVQGICGIDEADGVSTVCADVDGPDLEMAHDPAAYDPVTRTLWTGSYGRKVVTRIVARP